MMMFSLGGITYDSDAQAFFSAAGITDNTQKNAVNQLVLDLKSYSIWSKIYALYPFVGGSASQHSYNLMNPALYQITWNGGLTHNTNGVTGNGTTGYGDTGLNISSVLTLNNTALGIYIRNNISSSAFDIGGFIGTTKRFIFNPRTAVNLSSSQQYNTTVGMGTLQPSNSDSTGFNLANRRASNVHRVSKSGSLLGNNTGSGGSLPNTNVFICSVSNNGTAASFSDRNNALSMVSQGLTNTEESNLYTAIQTFQTTLGRQV